MILALETALRLGGTDALCISDSLLMVSQLNGVYRIKDTTLKVLAEKVKVLAHQFTKIKFQHERREHPFIKRADLLLNRSLDQAALYAKTSEKPAGEQRRLF